jgi:MerR family Zn(II)-responsive transcriptional regulator of zntA
MIKYRVIIYTLQEGTMVENKYLIKIGQLAKIAQVLPSKIRFYVKEGLIKPVDRTNGGYYLFDKQSALERLKLIEKLQKDERLRLHEIREKLNSRFRDKRGK